MFKYKSELERLNYYSWARFLEQVNDDNALIRVIDKFELAILKRADISYIDRFFVGSLRLSNKPIKRADMGVK